MSIQSEVFTLAWKMARAAVILKGCGKASEYFRFCLPEAWEAVKHQIANPCAVRFEKVRKNAKKKIAQYLEQAKSIELSTKTMQIDDSYNYHDNEASAADVMEWLANEDNYRDARIEIGYSKQGAALWMTVSGPYYFSDKYTANF